jgi:hypothetical protein
MDNVSSMYLGTYKLHLSVFNENSGRESSNDAPITDAVICYNEFLDAVTRRITLASAINIQRSWKLYTKGLDILE